MLIAGLGLFLKGQSTIVLDVGTVQRQIDTRLPMENDIVTVKAVTIQFLPGTDGVSVIVRGVIRGNVGTFPVPVRMGFGFHVTGQLRYNIADRSIYFIPTKVGSVRLKPGEDMPGIESIVDLAASVVGGVTQTASTAAGAVGRGFATAASRVGNFTGRFLPRMVRTGATKVGAAAANSVESVAAVARSGGLEAQRHIESLVITLAGAALTRQPVYRLNAATMGNTPTLLVERIEVCGGALSIHVSNKRHVLLRRLRIMFYVAAVIVVGVVIMSSFA